VREVVILSAARTPIGKFGGALREVHPAELGAVAARAAITDAHVDPGTIDEVVIGHGRQAGSGPNPGRQVAYRAGLPHAVPAQTINMACASGLQAVVSGARAIALGEASIVLAGGIESMSRMPFLIDAEDVRWGHKLGQFTVADAMYRDGFLCPLSGLIMGQTAEILARQYGISRRESDAYALESQQRAERAITAGHFKTEITPVVLPDSKGAPRVVGQDEHPRFGTTLDALAKLPPAFPEIEGHPGIITAGSSSGITDGGAALVLASAERARDLGVEPMARIVGWASVGVDPRIMGIGPVPAMRLLFARTGLSIEDFDLVELNEAFAAQVLAVVHDVPIPRDRLNVNGGAIALGHPIGCTGARILVTLVHEMVRRDARRGLATLCVSGGMGMALAVERKG
jgi:acetyl-CoA C-acetyltransferase